VTVTAGLLTTKFVVDLVPVLEVCSLEFNGRSEETVVELTSAKPTPSGEPPRRDNTTHHILGSRPICLELLTRRIGPSNHAILWVKVESAFSRFRSFRETLGHCVRRNSINVQIWQHVPLPIPTGQSFPVAQLNVRNE
jgi:hypothetical protein